MFLFKCSYLKFEAVTISYITDIYSLIGRCLLDRKKNTNPKNYIEIVGFLNIFYQS